MPDRLFIHGFFGEIYPPEMEPVQAFKRRGNHDSNLAEFITQLVLVVFTLEDTESILVFSANL